jgi:CheY-like chemotaxis protein
MKDTSNSTHRGRRTAVSRLSMLVVDDEPMVRELLVMILRLRGYKVFAAENGAEALALAKGFRSGTFDILITDMCMSGMSGDDLAERVHEARPEIKMIFTSGYSADELAAMDLHVPPEACLPKPFKPGAIDAAIRAVLDPELGLN